MRRNKTDVRGKKNNERQFNLILLNDVFFIFQFIKKFSYQKICEGKKRKRRRGWKKEK